MDFPFGTTVTRLRRKEVLDPYSKKPTLGDWSDPDKKDLEGAFIAQSSTTRNTTATRTQLLEEMSLYCSPDDDVQGLDRVTDGTATYTVDGIPAAPLNPFTGWQPLREIPLQRAIG